MSTLHPPLEPSQTVAHLASTLPGASRVFYRHGLDFCCHGHVPLGDACEKAGLEVDAILQEIQGEIPTDTAFERWDERPLPELIDHLLTQFHAPHREELPRLIEMAQKVERVHAEKSSCPKGLADHLTQMLEELEQHMQKEEQILFPMLLAGRGSMAAMPIQVMEEEHRDHGQNLERLRALTDNYTAPDEACGTWQALFIGVRQLESDLMQHIHIENNILFPRALRG